MGSIGGPCGGHATGGRTETPYEKSVRLRIEEAKKYRDENLEAHLGNYDLQAQREWLGAQPPADGRLTLYGQATTETLLGLEIMLLTIGNMQGGIL